MVNIDRAAVTHLLKLNQGTNGSDTYSNDRALYGYIDTSLYMVVTPAICAAMNAWHASDRSPDFSTADMGQRIAYSKIRAKVGVATEYVKNKDYIAYGKSVEEMNELLRLNILNYKTLRIAGLTNEEAYAVAALRTRWVALGCLYTTSDTDVVGNKTPFSEFLVWNGSANATDFDRSLNQTYNAGTREEIVTSFAEQGDFDAFAKAAKGTEVGSAWVVKTAEALWATSEYFVRTRGHHYKDPYEALMDKMYHSGFEGSAEFPKTISKKHIFHTAIHPFGLMMLPRMTYHFAMHSKLGNSYLLRLEAAPNGSAVITTTAAAISALKTEPWYNAFYLHMKEQVDQVLKLADLIMSDKYSYHNSANLYGAVKKDELKVGETTYTIEKAKAEAAPVSTVVQGFINYLNASVDNKRIRDFALRNAKSLEKHANNNPSLSIKITVICELAMEILADSRTTQQAADAIFPSVKLIEVGREALEGESRNRITS